MAWVPCGVMHEVTCRLAVSVCLSLRVCVSGSVRLLQDLVSHILPLLYPRSDEARCGGREGVREGGMENWMHHMNAFRCLQPLP